MGQFQDMLDKINLVEAQGFDPYKETYASRIGQLDAIEAAQKASTTSPTDPPLTNGQSELTASEVSKRFMDEGWEDPFQDIVTSDNKLNLSKLSYNYNLLRDNPDIGIEQEDYLKIINRDFAEERERTYGKNREIGEGLSFDLEDEPRNYRFSIGYRQGNDPKGEFKKGDPIYYRWDEKTGEHISYDTKEAYQEAKAKYEQVTGQDIKDNK